jgi:hypothetical protein
VRALDYPYRNTSKSRYMLVSLVLLVLMLPLVLQEGVSAPTPHRAAMEFGFTPSAGGWSYLSGANRSEPPTEQPATMRVGPGAYRSVVEVAHNVWPIRTRVRSSVSYRQQYLVPVFNSTYT